MGGGGTDFSAQAAAQELKKQRSRDALNLQFGVAGSAPAKTRADFTTPAVTRSLGTGESDTGAVEIVSPEIFDQAGFDAATAEYANNSVEAAKNKAAREALYGTVRNDAFAAGTRKLDESKNKAARDNKFALFAQGLNGGSEDIDQNALLDRTYNEGRLQLGAKADDAAASLRGNDEATRLGLLQSIDAGLDQGSALSSSLNSLRVNSDKATAGAQGTSLGDLFADAGLLYTKSKAGQGVADARSQFGSYFSNSGNGMGSRGRGYFGTQSSTG